ncbi:nicotinamide riboside kinase [Micromonospora sp. HB375]|uniref:AAA family ATPase n=1 Tax=unclassified Micromonospora TaxID=2617518 RepID=UPI001AE95394|nr:MULTISPECIES: AAA family ATPase [unclassified Micromonospora]MBP1782018.1 nicotinamide riboside kinase [Micromonospora sp. HB375]MDH6471376.1 nicotinamide riboside kinase [Micromonospora sp. H404/HB375]
MERQVRVRLGDVFVAGGMPRVTYNPRPSLHLEEKVADYLDERHKILSVSGPTKTGKTVLVRRALAKESSIWVAGGDIRTLSDLWAIIADELAVNTTHETTRQDGASAGRTTGLEMGIKGFIAGQRQGQETMSATHTDKLARERPTGRAAKRALATTRHVLVIDDFHYIATSVQLEIVRALKDLIFDGVPVIVIAVPHRAYDVVRVEKEMTGRVQHLSVGFWSNDELMEIAQRGFTALGAVDEGAEIATRLASESFASPHLMQEFCLHVCKYNGIRRKADPATALQRPSWSIFFEERALEASKSAFDVLVRGPRQRTDRKLRPMRNGLVVDIYGAVLLAIGKTGPLTSLTYEELRNSLRDSMEADPPQRNEVTRVLEELARISREHLEGEPVVDYDTTLSIVHISDPYFAFFLRHRAERELRQRAIEVPAISINGITNFGDVRIAGDNLAGDKNIIWRNDRGSK